MATKNPHDPANARAWAIVRRQHGVITRAQLKSLGYSDAAIRHRVRAGRLHRIHTRVYSAGRPQLTDRGRWMAAVLSFDAAVLSHLDAAAHYRLISRAPGRVIELSVERWAAQRPGVLIHRRRPGLLRPPRFLHNIPLTDPADTVIDIAPRLSRAGLERAINQADKLELATVEAMRARAAANARRPGATIVRDLIDRVTFVLSDSELERAFVPLALAAGLPVPETQTRVNGYRVDFHWPDLGLVVETDGGTFHRTPLQQTRDRRRDQAHTAAGLTQLRFTHGQVRNEPGEVVAVLQATAERLGQSSSKTNAAFGRAS